MSSQGSRAGGPRAVRPYVITGGRSGTPDAEPLPLETLVVASGLQLPGELQPEYRRIVELCQGMLSVAEVGAHLGQPPTIVRVLLCDLIESGHIRFRPPVGLGYIPPRPHHTPPQGPVAAHPPSPQRTYDEQDLLRKVLHGLEDRI
ncbi:hypothetical protein SRB5_16300 [Streptomyces sp. RB5]|uniref:DUF742 domain-containing protein n=1 Tax=Streptomyces smaragdinus TaxID=2585196 RepID=A0A7K0CDH0_9ACTN|nr:DUF742 domain-containing protein [Streptomyces smaragdinus]MQY11511.1 hypothetical protein [Streptomyces smaragdinus]